MHSPSKWFAIVGAALIGLTLMASAPSQPPPPSDDEVNAIAHQMYCPVCENVPLDVCPTEACAQWRATIREKLAEGWSESQIKDYFVEQYGARVLASPPARGLNWLVYILPPATFLAGAYILFRAFRSWGRPAEPQTPAESDSKVDPYVARLEEELRRRS
ncbi:MAG TPA: cytochrome c-type biogenesis protein CcmH [Anaerolineales bacterium]|nr:cytochrome c-type biogenesis protein CcmH [Anaerolineales bacterium]